MTLIRLRNRDIEDIIDNEEYYSVYGSTFNEDEKEVVTEVTFVTDLGERIHFGSIPVPYGNPIGLQLNPISLMREVLTLIADNEIEQLDLNEFIEWFMEFVDNNHYVIELTNREGIVRNVFIERIESGIYLDDWLDSLSERDLKLRPSLVTVMNEDNEIEQLDVFDIEGLLR